MTSIPNPIFLEYIYKEQVELIEFVKENNVKMVYWDLGGTLVDIPAIIKQKTIDEINAACKCQIDIVLYDLLIHQEWRQRETPEALKKIKSVKTDDDELEYWKDFFVVAFKKYGLIKSPKLIAKLAEINTNPKSFEVYPYVNKTLTKLDEMGVRSGIISNAFRSARRILKQKELMSKFNSEHVLLSCEYNSIKPEEDIYKIAIEKTGVEAKEIVFIDDRESFLIQAVNLGMNALIIRHDT